MGFVLQPDFVESSLEHLLRQKIHPHFAGYLCLKRTAARDGRTTALKPDFAEFFETFLRVPNGDVRRPYVRPFWDEEKSEVKAWYQRNIAGSYSAASARRIQPFMKVVDIKGAKRGATYSLRRGHAGLALRFLAFGRPVPVVALSAFLYRDYAVEPAEATIGTADVVKVFRDEFGYATEKGSLEFQKLYQDDSGGGDSRDLFEESP